MKFRIQHNLLHTAARYLLTESGKGSQGGMKINRGPILSPFSSGGISGERVQSSKRMRKKKSILSHVYIGNKNPAAY